MRFQSTLTTTQTITLTANTVAKSMSKWTCALSLARPSGQLNIPTVSAHWRLPGESKIYNNREVHVDRLAVFQAGLILPQPYCRNGRFLEAQTLSRCL